MDNKQQITSFEDDGYLVCEDVFDTSWLEGCHGHCMDAYSDIINRIESNKLEIGIGIKNGFKEIVQRHQSRFEMTYRLENDSFFTPILENLHLMELVKQILQEEDICIANKSCVISLQGAENQAWHSDGPHMSVQGYLPCHCLNVFIPLVDITLENGPTEFKPGSHKYTNNLAKGFLLSLARKQSRPIATPILKRGSALLFDYRVLHRGRGNQSSLPRPILVITFAKSWYRDKLNFPARSVLTAEESRTRNDQLVVGEEEILKLENITDHIDI